MKRTFKRGYIEKGWWNSLLNKFIENEYSITITRVTQSDEFGKFEDIDEDEINAFGGYKDEYSAFAELIEEFKCREIYDSKDKLIYSKLKEDK